MKNTKFLFPLLLLIPSIFTLASCGGDNATSSEEEIVIYDQEEFVLSKYDDGYYIQDYKGSANAVYLPHTFVEEDGTKVPVVGISDLAFSKRQSLTTIYLSNTIKSIGKNAFYQSSIKNVYVTTYLEDIDPEAFNSSQIEFYKQDDFSFLPTRDSRNGYLVGFNTDNRITDNIYDLTIPNGTKAIYKGLFNGFLGRIYFPDSIEAVFDGAFENANIAYSGSFLKLRHIGKRAFYNSQVLHFTKEGSAKYTGYGYEFKFSEALETVKENAFFAARNYRTFLGYDPVSQFQIYLPHESAPSGFEKGWEGNSVVHYGSK